MNKAETASYLVSLHTLLDAQSKGVHSIPSKVLSDEYNRVWDGLKELINKDQENEARNGQQQSLSFEDRTDKSGSIPRRSIPDRDLRGDFQGS